MLYCDIGDTGLSSLGAGKEFTMADWNDPRPTQTGFGASPRVDGGIAARPAVDQGLRRHMLSIYNYMTSGVLLTGIVALLFASSQSLMSLIYRVSMGPNGLVAQPNILGWIVIFSPLAIVFAMSMGANRFSKTTLLAMFWGFAALFGMSLSTLFLVYTGASLAATFFATSGAFAGLSLWGYTTKKDLSPWGTFLVMGLVGVIVSLLLNGLFFHSTGFDLAISFIGVFIFAGFTAYHTQRLRQQYYYVAGNAEIAGKAVVLGALQLYLDFINMFLFLLRFMGNSRN
jgi:FtsH-binding integral membrane protein